MNTDGTYTILAASRSGWPGYFVDSPLKVGPDGALYGTSSSGGTADAGTLFRVGLDGSISTLFNFDGITTGSGPYGNFVLNADGTIDGTTDTSPTGNGLVYQYNLSQSTFTVLDTYNSSINPNLSGITVNKSGQYYITANALLVSSPGEGVVYHWAP